MNLIFHYEPCNLCKPHKLYSITVGQYLLHLRDISDLYRGDALSLKPHLVLIVRHQQIIHYIWHILFGFLKLRIIQEFTDRVCFQDTQYEHTRYAPQSLELLGSIHYAYRTFYLHSFYDLLLCRVFLVVFLDCVVLLNRVVLFYSVVLLNDIQTTIVVVPIVVVPIVVVPIVVVPIVVVPPVVVPVVPPVVVGLPPVARISPVSVLPVVPVPITVVIVIVVIIVVIVIIIFGLLRSRESHLYLTKIF
ncbi:hypothetical protein MT325_m441L [Paramecium bursaria chlorella virus MT325]|uniref:Uncharacterized protein m441L n=1 Tax=Paramecium bursaria Chlorella virus MT325 TaxID=346932 RepID=A7IUH1_PBCVM|nr:hypothetical protein MT325_m441L [Paramecium bursaria chlorella virus MT325]